MNIDLVPFENRLIEVIGTEPPGIISDGMAMTLSGGKRIRPQVILTLGKSLEVETRICLDYAVAVELIHSASLILDDLPSMDNTDQRRGLPALHISLGVGIATLVSFSMLARAFDVLNDTRLDDLATRSQLCQLLARTIGGGGMAEGQAQELHSKSESYDPLEIAHLKTASLFSASLSGVGKIAKVDPMTVSILTKLGDSMGKAFQFCDDLHDGDAMELEVLRSELERELTNSRELLTQLPDPFHSISFLANWIEESAEEPLSDASDAP